MIKILVVSDSHGNSEDIKTLVNENEFNYMFFLGDTLLDVENLKLDNLIKVRGNWDYDFSTKSIITVKIENVKFLLLHGHGFGVKHGLGYLIKETEKEKVDFVCYGHTHMSSLEYVNGIGYLNPGAFSYAKNGKKTYAVLTLENGKVSAEIKYFK